MVCLGNICRSPIAEGLLQQKAQNAGLQWQIDSCGTETFHIGENPDKRGVEVCKERGLNIAHHVARRLTINDFEEFDKIIKLYGFWWPTAERTVEAVQVLMRHHVILPMQ